MKIATASLAILAVALTAMPAAAADMPVKALPAPAAAPYAALNGLFIGFGVSGSGTNFDVLGGGLAGGVNAAGHVIDIHASYKFYDGARYAAITAGCGYDMTMNANAIGGVPNDHLFCTELVDLGGWLGSVVNISQNPMLPDFLKGAIPFVTVGAAQRLSKTGRAAGIGMVLPITSAPNWVAGARILNIDYSNAQADPLTVMKTENYVGIFVERKFGTGTLGLFGN